MTILYAVYGAGGLGREVMPLLRQKIHDGGSLFFVVDDKNNMSQVNGHPVLSFEEFKNHKAYEKYFIVAISDGEVRARIFERCCSAGFKPYSLVADNVIIMDDVKLGAGAILSPFSCLTSNIEIGLCFQANIYSYVGHDCRVGDYVTLAPGVKCNGNVVIENHVYVGAGAIIKPGSRSSPTIIGRGATIGMGAVVIQNVAPGAHVFGNPARTFSINKN